MTELEYQSFYDRVGKLIGWDFSKLKVKIDGEQWDFYNEVTQRCKKSDLLLDIGAGGGERLLSIADSALLLVGIDLSNEMVQTAKTNLQKSKKPNVRFMQMDAENLEFPSSFFNVVSCRHSNFSELDEAGFNDIQSFEYEATEYYQSYEDLLFLLKHTPIIPDFGECTDDFDIVQTFIEENQTEQGIMTNSNRFMIIANK